MPFKIVAMALLCCLAGLVPPGFSQTEDFGTTIRAGVFVNPPFVMREGDGFRGMAVDLWELTAQALGCHTRYVEYANLPQLLRDAQAGSIDVIVTNLTPTHARARVLTFSFPWYDAGTRVMTRADTTGQVWYQLRKSGQLRTYAGIFLLLVALSFGMTLVRRRLSREFPRGWAQGLSRSFYDLVSLAKSGHLDFRNLGWFGHLLTAIWMIFGVALIAYITSSVTSAMTTVSLRNDINSVADLPGKRVGTLAGSPEEEVLRQMGIMCVGYEHIAEAVDALLQSQLDALVSDAPVLEYWAATHPGQKLQVVGNIIHPEKYAFATGRQHMEHMNRISVELIRLHETGKVQALRENYFGKTP